MLDWTWLDLTLCFDRMHSLAWIGQPPPTAIKSPWVALLLGKLGSTSLVVSLVQSRLVRSAPAHRQDDFQLGFGSTGSQVHRSTHPTRTSAVAPCPHIQTAGEGGGRV